MSMHPNDKLYALERAVANAEKLGEDRKVIEDLREMREQARARPQPVAVAGDAVREALRALADAVFGRELGSEPDVYAGAEHPHEAQQPTKVSLTNL